MPPFCFFGIDSGISFAYSEYMAKREHKLIRDRRDMDRAIELVEAELAKDERGFTDQFKWELRNLGGSLRAKARLMGLSAGHLSDICNYKKIVTMEVVQRLVKAQEKEMRS